MDYSPSNKHRAAAQIAAPSTDASVLDQEDDLVEEFAASAALHSSVLELFIPDSLAGERADKALAVLLPDYSRSRLQQWIETGAVTRNGQPLKVRSSVVAGERLFVRPQASDESRAMVAEAIPLPVVFEDEQIAVIDKPAGLVVHPAAGNWSGTLLNGLLYRYPDSATLPRAGIVHRLDKDTSGLMVVARTLIAQTDLVRQLQARSVKRSYLAVVWGCPAAAGMVDRPIGRDPRDRLRMSTRVGSAAKPARTYFSRLAIGSLEGKDVALVRCDLETGRTHQIRVHMEALGHPLLGDPVYRRGVPGVCHTPFGFARQALHATRLGLIHPTRQQPCVWHAPLPGDLLQLLSQTGLPVDVELD